MEHGARIAAFRIVFWLLTATVATPQTLVTPDRLPAELRDFDGRVHQQFPCTLTTTPAVLDLGFRFRTGFTVEAPLRHHTGAAFVGHSS